MKKTKRFSWLIFLLCSIVLTGCSTATGNTAETAASTTANDVTAKFNREDLTFKSQRDTDIHATVITPEELGNQKRPLVLFSHGFTGSREGMGTFEQMAAKLAAQGILSIMIDFPGCNDSDEPYTSYTVTNMSNDMDSAIDYMIDTYEVDQEKIGLMGHSMGGRMTALKLTDKIEAAALWAPAAAPGISGLYDFMEGKESVEKLYKTAKKDGKVLFTLWGKENEVELSLDLFESMKASDPLKTINDYPNNLFVAVALADTAIYKTTTDAVIGAATNTKELKVISIPEANHVFTNANDEEDVTSQNFVIEQTADFLIEHLAK